MVQQHDGLGLKKRLMQAESQVQKQKRAIARLEAEVQAARASSTTQVEVVRTQAAAMSVTADELRQQIDSWSSQFVSDVKAMSSAFGPALSVLKSTAEQAVHGSPAAEVEAALQVFRDQVATAEALLDVKDVRIVELQGKAAELSDLLLYNGELLEKIHVKGVLGVELRRKLRQIVPRDILSWKTPVLREFVQTDAYRSACLELFVWYLNEWRRQDAVGLTKAYGPDLLIQAAPDGTQPVEALVLPPPAAPLDLSVPVAVSPVSSVDALPDASDPVRGRLAEAAVLDDRNVTPAPAFVPSAEEPAADV